QPCLRVGRRDVFETSSDLEHTPYCGLSYAGAVIENAVYRCGGDACKPGDIGDFRCCFHQSKTIIPVAGHVVARKDTIMLCVDETIVLFLNYCFISNRYVYFLAVFTVFDCAAHHRCLTHLKDFAMQQKTS